MIIIGCHSFNITFYYRCCGNYGVYRWYHLTHLQELFGKVENSVSGQIGVNISWQGDPNTRLSANASSSSAYLCSTGMNPLRRTRNWKSTEMKFFSKFSTILALNLLSNAIPWPKLCYVGKMILPWSTDLINFHFMWISLHGKQLLAIGWL